MEPTRPHPHFVLRISEGSDEEIPESREKKRKNSKLEEDFIPVCNSPPSLKDQCTRIKHIEADVDDLLVKVKALTEASTAPLFIHMMAERTAVLQESLLLIDIATPVFESESSQEILPPLDKLRERVEKAAKTLQESSLLLSELENPLSGEKMKRKLSGGITQDKGTQDASLDETHKATLLELQLRNIESDRAETDEKMKRLTSGSI